MTTTYDDVHDVVCQVLDGCVGEYDAHGITTDLVAAYDLTGDRPTQMVGDLGEEFWDVVLRHDLEGGTP